MPLYIFWPALFLSLLTQIAEATWKPEYAQADPQLQAWYSSQYNAQGKSCCAQSDAYAYYGDYTINADGSVEFDSGDVHHKVPADKVLLGTNPTGHAVWWHAGNTTYCFAPGGGT